MRIISKKWIVLFLFLSFYSSSLANPLACLKDTFNIHWKKDLTKQVLEVRSKWESLPLEKMSIGDDVFIEWNGTVDSPGTFLFGKIQKISAAEDGELLVYVADQHGISHLVDPKHRLPLVAKGRSNVEFRRRPMNNQGNVTLIAKTSEKFPLLIKPERLKKILCLMRAQMLSDLRLTKIERYVRNQYRYAPHHPAQIKKIAVVAGTSFFLGYNMPTAPYRIESRNQGQTNWMTEHSSNFDIGWNYMAIMYTALKVGGVSWANPNLIRQALNITFGSNVLGNIWEEIDLPGVPQKSLPIFNSIGQEVQTDIEDFKAGVFSSLAFFVFVKIVETGLEASYMSNCSVP